MWPGHPLTHPAGDTRPRGVSGSPGSAYFYASPVQSEDCRFSKDSQVPRRDAEDIRPPLPKPPLSEGNGMSSTPAYREHSCIADSALHGVHKPIGANIFR